MKICIYGVGAIGGLIGSRLAATGQHQLSAIARGPTLAALAAHGFWLQEADGSVVQAPVQASAQPADLGVQDLVVIAVKGPAMAAVAEGISPLLGPQTVVLPAMNGVPWWFSACCPALGSQPLQSVDPGGRLAAAIPLQQVLGCVVHASAFTPEPGRVQHAKGLGLIIGEPAGGPSSRVAAIAQCLRQAGFEATESDHLRQALWYKLWGNLTMNPVSAITGAPIDQLLADPLVRDFCTAAMVEAARLGEQIGCHIDQTPQDRHHLTAQLGAFKTSMLQDVEAGRPIELDAIVGAVREMAQRLGQATPHIDALLGLTRLFARGRGLYPPA